MPSLAEAPTLAQRLEIGRNGPLPLLGRGICLDPKAPLGSTHAP